MKSENWNKFPCGFEELIKIETGIFDFLAYRTMPTIGCPLHGKNCKRSR